MRDLIPPIPKFISSHRLYPILLSVIRFIQFLSGLISLILFSIYISHLITTIAAQGAVQSIVAAALAYTIIATLISLFVKVGYFAMKAILIGLDLCFVIGFIAVAALTSPMSGAARRGCGSRNGGNDKRSDNNRDSSVQGANCGLVTGTFTLTITFTCGIGLDAAESSVSFKNLIIQWRMEGCSDDLDKKVLTVLRHSVFGLAFSVSL